MSRNAFDEIERDTNEREEQAEIAKAERAEAAGRDARTDGETGDCKGCRYWSEMLARVDGWTMKAACLQRSSKHHGNYTPSWATCDGWASGHFGAIDEPGQIDDAYAEAT